jgi:hypothetical protein
MNHTAANQSPLQRLAIVVIYALAVFLGAFLLFQVQPIMGKYILPWFGGSPGVWTTCMLVFQSLLCAGYAYAHFLTKYATRRGQVFFHATLLLASLFLLPITPSPEWKPDGNAAPILWIITLLLVNVGLPYFLLSATGPLLQAWIARSGIIAQPYRLYALSNVGSLLALVTYPFLIETWLSSGQQAITWSLLFSAFAIVCPLAGLLSLRHRITDNAADNNSSSKEANHPQLSAWHFCHWFLLAFLPSMMLLAITNQVCLDIAVIPFLWIAPLCIYLMSFILCFESQRWYYRRPYIALSFLSFLGMLYAISEGPELNYLVQIGIYFSGLFLVCMVCHGELVHMKPEPKFLTSFYMTMSIGGAAGGLFVGVAAPLMFNEFLELQVGIILCGVTMVALYFMRNRGSLVDLSPKRQLFYTFCTIVTLIALIANRNYSTPESFSVRNFYGVLRVNSQFDKATESSQKLLLHGRIVHGSQFEKPEIAQEPTTYYTQDAGVGLALSDHKPNSPRTIGVVGLGAGTLAVYGKPQDRWKFYEINPDVIRIAQEHFTYLSNCPAELEVLPGDARLTLANEKENQFDILVLDAFSGDAIPIHLLTTEAMDIYRSCLKKDGILVIHITNQYFDLAPVAHGLAEYSGFHARVIDNFENLRPFANRSVWALLSASPSTLQAIHLSDPKQTVPVSKKSIWTDDRSNLFEALR